MIIAIDLNYEEACKVINSKSKLNFAILANYWLELKEKSSLFSNRWVKT